MQYLLIGIIEEVEKVLSDIRITVARIDFDTMGHIVKKGNEVWFEYVLEKPKKNVERTKQISLRKLV